MRVTNYIFNQNTVAVKNAVVALIVALLMSGCALFLPMHQYDYLPDSQAQKIIISKYEPRSELQCNSLGFLPCSLNSKNDEVVIAGSEYRQCARNILSYAEKVYANYIYIEEPLNFLGINWRDSKANLYKCLWLPQPQK